MPTETIFGCRCCDRAIVGTNDGAFGHDSNGPWRRIEHIDGPDAICPTCVDDPHALDALVEDGYEAASITIAV